MLKNVFYVKKLLLERLRKYISERIDFLNKTYIFS